MMILDDLIERLEELREEHGGDIAIAIDTAKKHKMGLPDVENAISLNSVMHCKYIEHMDTDEEEDAFELLLLTHLSDDEFKEAPKHSFIEKHEDGSETIYSSYLRAKDNEEEN